MKYQSNTIKPVVTFGGELIKEIFEWPSILDDEILPLFSNIDMDCFEPRKVCKVGGKILFPLAKVHPENFPLNLVGGEWVERRCYFGLGHFMTFVCP